MPSSDDVDLSALVPLSGQVLLLDVSRIRCDSARAVGMMLRFGLDRNQPGPRGPVLSAPPTRPRHEGCAFQEFGHAEVCDDEARDHAADTP